MVSCLDDIEIIIMQYRCDVRRLERDIATRKADIDECEAMQRICQELYDQLVDLNVKLSAHHRKYQEVAVRLEQLSDVCLVSLDKQDTAETLHRRLSKAQLEKRQLNRKIERLLAEGDQEVDMHDPRWLLRRGRSTRACVGRRITSKTFDTLSVCSL